MGHFELSLLGSPRIGRESTWVTFTRRRALALLAYLAVTNREHSRDRLTELLGDSAADLHASKHLSNALAELRHRLGACVVADRHLVSLDPELPCKVDVHEFERLMSAEQLTLDELERGLAFYRGEFLADFWLPGAPLFQEWLLFERERLEALYVRGLRTAVAAGQAEHMYARVLPIARRLAEREPWSDDAQRQLMHVLSRTSQRYLGIAHFESYAKRLHSELGLAPEPETVALYERLRASIVAPESRLPAAKGAFIGRAEERRRLIDLLADPHCRVVSVVGIAGSGKSRLALDVAQAFARPAPDLPEQPFPHGVFFVSLAGLRPPTVGGPTLAESVHQIVTLLSATLGVHIDATPSAVRHVQDYLRERSLLLVLDGVEGLPASVDALIRMFAVAPGVKFLLTSRMRLHLPEEHIVELGGLAPPDTSNDLDHSEAGAFFLREVNRERDITTLSDADRAAAVEICVALCGLPLPLKLAAQYARGMGLPAIQAAIEEHLDFLAVDSRDVHPDQRNLRALFDESISRLRPDDSMVLQRLTVFRGSFDAEAAAAVADATLQQLLALRDIAFVTIDEQGRYRLVPLVRRHARDILETRPEEAADVRARHARYYARVTERALYGTYSGETRVDELLEEEGNLLAAWEWAAAALQTDLIVELRICLTMWCELTGRVAEGAMMLNSAAEHLRAALVSEAPPDPLVQHALQTVLAEQGRFLLHLGRREAAEELLAEAFDVPHTAALERGRVYDLYRRAEALATDNDSTGAYRFLEQALQMARNTGSRNLETLIRARLGVPQTAK